MRYRKPGHKWATKESAGLFSSKPLLMSQTIVASNIGRKQPWREFKLDRATQRRTSRLKWWGCGRKIAAPHCNGSESINNCQRLSRQFSTVTLNCLIAKCQLYRRTPTIPCIAGLPITVHRKVRELHGAQEYEEETSDRSRQDWVDCCTASLPLQGTVLEYSLDSATTA